MDYFHHFLRTIPGVLENQSHPGTFSLEQPLRQEAECFRGHKPSLEEEQLLSTTSRDFQIYECLPHSVTSILGKNLLIRCKDIGVTVKARVAHFERFDEIKNTMAESSPESTGKALVSPIIEVELMRKQDVLPSGVEIGLRHFLTVPLSEDTKEEMEATWHRHSLVKIARHGGIFQSETIKSFWEVDTEYFWTSKLAGKPLCYILATTIPECEHSTLKQIILTKREELCSHVESSMAMYCVCEASMEEFDKMMQKDYEATVPIFNRRYHIEKSEEVQYYLHPSTTFPFNPDVEAFEISHHELCMYAGVLRLGVIM